MQERCKKSCKYSKALVPKDTIKRCIVCGHPETELKKETLQEKCFSTLKKHFGNSAVVTSNEDGIKVKTKHIYDADFEILKSIEGMYKELDITRSDKEVLVIIKFAVSF